MRSQVMSFCSLVGMMAVVMLAACKGSSVEDFSAALVERLTDGSIAWNIRADGSVKALCKSRDEKPIMAHVKGKMTTGDGAVVDLEQDEKSGVLEGKGLKLGGELTQAKYDLTVDDKPWSGTLFIPLGGTADLAAGASASAKVKLPETKIGPHGGTLQVVGGDVVELSANASLGELRAYLLDAQLKAVAAADREIKIGFVADGKAELVTLVPEPGGAYFIGKIGMTVDPIEVTISVKAKGQAHAQFALIGFQPGVAIDVGATAPRVKLMVKADIAAPSADLNAAAGAGVKGEIKGAGAGANLKTGLDIKPPSVKVSAGAAANPAAQAGAGAKAGADTKAAATADSSKKATAGGKVQLKLP